MSRESSQRGGSDRNRASLTAALLELLRGQIDPTTDDRSIRERGFVVVVSLVAVPILVAFAIEILLTPGEPRALAAVHLTTAAVLAAGGAIVFTGRSATGIALLARLALLGLAVVMTSAFLLIRDDFSILWVGLLPPLFVFVCRLREGLLWCAVALAGWIFLLEQPERFAALGAPAPWPGRDENVDFAMAFLCLAAVSVGFELLRVNARRRLQEQIDAQLQRSRLEAAGMLTSGIAHDFNNLLTVIKGNLDLLSSSAAASEEDRSELEEAISATDRAAQLTDKLLAYSRKQPLRPEAIDVEEMLTAVASLLRGSFGSSVEIETDVADAPLICRCDAAQLENALVNLAMNAYDAMPEGGRLTFAARRHEETGDEVGHPLVKGPYVCITVTDTGPGIPGSLRARVFDPYFTTKPPGAGTGLGLSMVQGFARQSGGEVLIRERVGTGASVAVYLPAAS